MADEQQQQQQHEEEEEEEEMTEREQQLLDSVNRFIDGANISRKRLETPEGMQALQGLLLAISDPRMNAMMANLTADDLSKHMTDELRLRAQRDADEAMRRLNDQEEEDGGI